MEDEQVHHEALEQVQELQHQLQDVLEGQSPPMIQRLIRTGLIIRVRVIRVWWDVIGRASWLRSRCRRPRCWSLLTEHVTEVIEVSLKYVIEVPTRTISNTVAIYTCLPKTRPIVTEFTSCCSLCN